MAVNLEFDGPKALITIDDPERRNPISVTVMEDLLESTRRAIADDDSRVIVYTGGGDVFSAGGDLSGSFADDAIGLHRQRGVFADLFRMMYRSSKPTVARVNGHALAGGFGLAAACDITICVEDARLGCPEVNVGLWPMMISAVLSRVMPPKAVLEMMLTGRTITPDEALRLGVVTRVVTRADLDRTVDEVVATLASRSPAILAMGRESFYSILDSDLDTALDRLQLGLTAVMSTADASEGVAAFREKREPRWTGQ